MVRTLTGNYLSYQRAPSATPPSGLSDFLTALAKQESGGAKNPYAAIGKRTKSGDVAYGKYQIMGANIPSWTKQYLGTSMTPKQFLDDPKAQEQLMTDRAQQLYTKYGNWNDVASVHFSGQPVSKAGNAADVNGTTVPQYVQNVMKFMGIGTASAGTVGDTPAPAQKPGTPLTPAPAPALGSGTPAPAPAKNTMTPTLNEDQLKQNIDALKQKGMSTADVQSYVNNYSKAGDGSYTLKSSGTPAPSPSPAGSTTAPPAAAAPLAFNMDTGQATNSPGSASATSGPPQPGIVQSVVDAIAQPFIDTSATIAHFMPGQQEKADQGVNFGYLGTAKSAIQPTQTWQKNTWDTLGLGLNLASFMVPVGEVAKGGDVALEGAEVAGKTGGIAAKAASAAKSVVAKPTLEFAGLQGGSAAATAKGGGASNKQAAEQGAGAAVLSAATLGIMNFAGGVTGSFVKTLAKTKAADVVTGMISDAVERVKSLVTPEVENLNAADFKSEINAASQEVAQAKATTLDFASSNHDGMFKTADDAEKGFQSILHNYWGNVRGMYSATRAQFGKVMNSGFSITKADASKNGLFDVMGEYQKYSAMTSEDLEAAMKSGQIGAKEFMAALTKDKDSATSVSQPLTQYMAKVKADIVQPLLAGKAVDIGKLDDLIHFQAPRGNPTEQAAMSRIQDSIYQTFEKAMTERAPDLVEEWQGARAAFTKQSTAMQDKISTIFGSPEVKGPSELADRFISGTAAKSVEDVQWLNKFLGKGGMQTLQTTILQQLFASAKKTFNGAIGAATPTALADASGKAASILTDFADKMDQVNSDSAQLMTSQQIAFIRDASRTVGGTMDDFVKNATKALGGDAESMATKMDQVMRGGGELYELATKYPSRLAEKIGSLAPEDLEAVKSIYGDKKVDIKLPDGTTAQVKQWDAITGNLLQKVLSRASNFFSSGATTEAADKFITAVGNLGGADKDRVMKSLFGDNPEVMKGLTDLFKMVDFAKDMEASETKGAASTIGHGLAAIVFSMTHHPILALSSGRTVIENVIGGSTESEYADEITAKIEKSGKIPVTGFRKIAQYFTAALKNYFSQQAAGRGSAAAGKDAVQAVQ